VQAPIENHDFAGRRIAGPDQGSRQLKRICGSHCMKAHQSTRMGADIFVRQYLDPRFLQRLQQSPGGVFIIDAKHALAPKPRECVRHSKT
jgi:hypothetical protein